MTSIVWSGVCGEYKMKDTKQLTTRGHDHLSLGTIILMDPNATKGAKERARNHERVVGNRILDRYYRGSPEPGPRQVELRLKREAEYERATIHIDSNCNPSTGWY